MRRVLRREARIPPVTSPDALQGVLFCLKEGFCMFVLPISEASMSEALARVTFAYIRMRFHQTDMLGVPSLVMMQLLYDELHEAGLDTVAFWVLAYKRQWAPLFSLTLIRENFILDARRGLTWRRVAY